MLQQLRRSVASRNSGPFSRSLFCSAVVDSRKAVRRAAPPSGSGFTAKDSHSATVTSYKKREKSIDDLVVPVPVKILNNPDDMNVGEELSGPLQKHHLLQIIASFSTNGSVRDLGEEQGLNQKLFHQTLVSFRRFCYESNPLPADLHVVLSDIIRGKGRPEDLFPFFLEHARRVFPHLECLDDLKKISDLREPHNWYPEARSIQRKIVFHAGPTNSGKTYQALKSFMEAKSGVYCGPLKLLANEVYYKTNSEGVPCDLVTGEERKGPLVTSTSDEETGANKGASEKAPHVSCTVEMLDTSAPFEVIAQTCWTLEVTDTLEMPANDVAVIDEIQMVKDWQRGWAWSRALLGVNAEEVHLCGEGAALDLIRELLTPIGEDVEVHTYKRMTPLKVLDAPLGSFANVQDGDCFVCFSKKDIFNVSRAIEKQKIPVAVIYGSLPPATKLAQAKKFNDPQDPCKVMVATDAIGMGLNLSIKRIIFYSLMKPNPFAAEDPNVSPMEPLTTSQALQIGGRAGRYGTQYEMGQVTTFRPEDLRMLQQILSRPVEPLEQAGLRPTADQVELFSYQLPQASLSNLLNIFLSLCSMDDSMYFMCGLEDTLFLAEMIDHIPLPLRTRYTFCLAPVNRKQAKVCAMFVKFARKFSRGEPMTIDWLCGVIGWPLSPPHKLLDLVNLEAIFDVLDLYLWLGYRYADMFPDTVVVREMQNELDEIIQLGVSNIVKLLKESETATSSGLPGLDPDNETFRRRQAVQKANTEASTTVALSRDEPDSKSQPGTLVSSMPLSAKRRGKRSPLTESLIEQGLLTRRMLAQLKDEWKRDEKTSTDTPPTRKW